MEEKTYIQKLQDPRWQRKRLEVIQRDDFKCQHCGADEKPLQIHHIAYNFQDPWEIENRLLLSLCADCHDAETIAVKAAFSLLIQNLKLTGFTSSEIELLASVFEGGDIIRKPYPTLLDKIMEATDHLPNSNFKKLVKNVTDGSPGTE